MTDTLSIDDALKQLKAEAQQTLQRVLEENKNRWEADIQAKQTHILEKINPDFVKLNIGGKKFVTNKTVLSNIKGTKLERMINGKYPIMLDHKDRIFFDRNGEYFGYVLDCLRQGKVELPSDSYLSRRVQAEYEFFDLLAKKETEKIEKKVIEEEVKTQAQIKIQPAYPKPVMGGGLFGTQHAPLVSSANTGMGIMQYTTPITVAQPVTGKIDWGLALSELAKQDGVTTDGKSVKTDLCAQIISNKKFKDGVHEWRFLVDKFNQTTIANNTYDEDFGEVVFGIVHKDTWEKIKDIEDMTGCCGFTTTGEVMKGVMFDDNGTEGMPQADGPTTVEEVLLNKREITLTFDVAKGTLAMKANNSNTQYTLTLKKTGSDLYYPYFFIENASITLLEAKNLQESAESDSESSELSAEPEEEGWESCEDA